MFLNTEKLKRFNMDLVRSVLKNGESATKNSLALNTGLSLSTCGNILGEMLEQGEILEAGLADSTGGRPSRRYIYNRSHKTIALIYPRREKKIPSLYVSVVDMAGEALFEEVRKPSDIKGDDLISLSGELVEKFDNLSVLSFGVPAVVQNGVIGSCELEGLSHMDLKGVLKRRFSLDVSVENDVNCSALGYFDSFKTKRPESLVYMYYPEEGFSGAGIVVNGRVLRGERDFAGEISFLPFGAAMDKQVRIQKNPRKFVEHVNMNVQSINCLINPGCMVISGNLFTDDIQNLLIERIEKSSPEGQIPYIAFEPDMHGSYRQGLIREGMRLLSCGFDVIASP